MMTLLAVAAGGALGGACRFLATRVLDRLLGTAFPWATLAINLSGAFLAGLIATAGGGLTGALFLTGFCGSYTTVSSWSLQTLALARAGYSGRALANLLATTLAGLAAVAAGAQTALAMETLL